MSSGFSNPIIGGGGALVYPAIQSPNFNVAAQTGWAIQKNGNAYFFNITVVGGTVEGTNWILNPKGYFQYSGTPAAGNLIQSYAPVHGTDAFGNAYPGQTPINNFISANGQTFNNNQSWYLRSGGSGVSYTGLIMAPGLYDGQQCQIVDTDFANTLTMAASATSNVAGGTANVIGPSGGAGFVWITPNNLWYPL